MDFYLGIGIGFVAGIAFFTWMSYGVREQHGTYQPTHSNLDVPPRDE